MLSHLLPDRFPLPPSLELPPKAPSREPSSLSGKPLTIRPEEPSPGYDYVKAPPHYTWHPLVSAANYAAYFPYNIATANTYLYRLGYKPQHEDKSGVEQQVQDIRKAIRHLQFHVNLLEGRKCDDPYPY